MPVAAALLAALTFAAAQYWCLWHRGPWYDDFYTWYVTRPERGFLASFEGSWLVDNHPPLFYALVWLGRPLAASIESARQINLVVLGLGLSGGWALVRARPQYRWMAAALLLVIAANPAVMGLGTELRSYFMSLTASALVALALTVGWIEGKLDRGGERLVLWLALLVGFNTHILTSVIIGAIVTPFIVAAWLSGRRGLAFAILKPAVVSGLVLVGFCLVQIPLWWSNTAKFWIPAGFSIARWSIEIAIERCLRANLVLLLAAMAGGVMLVVRWMERRGRSPMLEALLLLGIGVGLACILLVSLHMMRPMVLERYLAALIAPVAMMVALSASDLARRLGGRLSVALIILALPVSLWATARNVEKTTGIKSWFGASSVVAKIQHGCIDTAVHIDPGYWNAFTIALPPADNKAVMPAAYRQVAQRMSIRVEPTTSRRLSSSCPTLFWVEHDTVPKRSASSILDHLQRQGFKLGKVWVYRYGIGWIASDRPLPVTIPAD